MTIQPLDIGAFAIASAGITSFLSDKDLDRLLGPTGGMILSLVILIVLVRHTAKRSKIEDAAKEKRHGEMLDALREQTQRNDDLLEKIFQLNGEQSKILVRTTVAVESVNSTLQRFAETIEECHKRNP